MNRTPMVRGFCGHQSLKREYSSIEEQVKGNVLKTLSESFTSYTIPFPIAVSDLSAPGQNTSNITSGEFASISNPIFEFNICQYN